MAAVRGVVDEVSPRVAAARRASSAGQLQHAVAFLEAALAHEPQNVRAYYEAARVHAQMGDFGSFERTVDSLRRLAPRHPGVHHMAGELYEWLSMPKRAATCYRKASQLKGALPQTLVSLAGCLERIHRLEEASELLDRALAASPGLPQGQLVRARVARRGGEVEVAETTLRDLIQSQRRDSTWRLEALGELAALLDHQGDFAGAIAAIGQCKEQQLQRDSKEWGASEHVLQRFRKAIDSITAEDFRRWHESGRWFVPQRIGLLTGFPRSGTTLLEQVFNAHPQLVSAEERDFVARQFFPSIHNGKSHDAPVQQVLDGVSARRLQAERTRYFEAMEYLRDEPLRGRMLLDKNPAYNPVLPIMLRLFPELRVIVAIRDPRDVVLSCYLRYLPLNPVSVRFLNLERTADRYALDMSAWLRFREMILAPWCEIRYEEVVTDLEAQARRSLQTLDLPWDGRVLNYRTRLATAPVMSPTYESVAKPIYQTSVGRWHNYEAFLEPVFDKLAPFIQAFGYA